MPPKTKTQYVIDAAREMHCKPDASQLAELIDHLFAQYENSNKSDAEKILDAYFDALEAQ